MYLGDAVAEAGDDVDVLENIGQEGHVPPQIYIDIRPRRGASQASQHKVLKFLEELHLLPVIGGGVTHPTVRPRQCLQVLLVVQLVIRVNVLVESCIGRYCPNKGFVVDCRRHCRGRGRGVGARYIY